MTIVLTIVFAISLFLAVGATLALFAIAVQRHALMVTQQPFKHATMNRSVFSATFFWTVIGVLLYIR